MLYFPIITLLSAACAVNAVANTVVVQVGKDSMPVFSPKNLSVHVGDNITWTFQGNHSVVQAANSSSCTPMKGGYNSGTKGKGETVTQTVNKAGVMYMICTVKDHCLGDGMKMNVTVLAAGGTTGKTSSNPEPTGTGTTFATGSNATNATGSADSTNSTDGSDGSDGSGDNSNSTDPSGAAMHGVSSVVVTAMALFVGLAL